MNSVFLKSLLLLWILLISVPFIAGSNEDCPPEEDISPCVCIRNDRGAFIKCDSFTSSEKIAQVLRNVQAYKIVTFTLSNSSLQYIPNGVFEDVHLTTLEFESDIFVQLFDTVPLNPGIEGIVFKEVRVAGGWNWVPFQAFTQLFDLMLIEVPLRGLSNFKEYAPRSLLTIMFYKCDLRKFRKHEFQDFPDLYYIDISHDKISELHRSMFARPSQISHMQFDYNRIASIPSDLFDDMDITMVSFLDNRLTVLPETTFKPLWHKQMRLEGNPLVCDCGMKWIWGDNKASSFSGTCSDPKIMQGKKLKDLTGQDFTHC